MHSVTPLKTQALLEYLQQLQRQGETHVHLDDSSRLILREFYKRAKRAPQPADSPIKTASNKQQKLIPQPPVQQETQAQITPAQVSPAPDLTTSETAPFVNLKLTPLNSADSPELQLQDLGLQAKQWAESNMLTTLRNKAVLGEGNPSAKLVFVGDSPGYHEEKTGTPFNGPAGQKLNAILKAMGLTREDVYLTYIVKLRPSQPQQTTNTRKPTQQEVSAFQPFFAKEMEIIQPSLIIALGAEAGSGLLGIEQPLHTLRESPHQYQNTPLIVTFPLLHLLHKEATTEKRQLWEDMLTAMELIQLPISEKQRNYFLKSK